MPLYNKKKLTIILIYVLFFIAIPIIKNESRLIEKKTQSYKSQIFILEKDLLEASLEFQYLTSPAVLSSKVENNLDQTYSSLDLSQIYLSTENFKAEQKINRISINEK